MPTLQGTAPQTFRSKSLRELERRLHGEFGPAATQRSPPPAKATAGDAEKVAYSNSASKAQSSDTTINATTASQQERSEGSEHSRSGPSTLLSSIAPSSLSAPQPKPLQPAIARNQSQGNSTLHAASASEGYRARAVIPSSSPASTAAVTTTASARPPSTLPPGSEEAALRPTKSIHLTPQGQHLSPESKAYLIEKHGHRVPLEPADVPTSRTSTTASDRNFYAVASRPSQSVAPPQEFHARASESTRQSIDSEASGIPRVSLPLLSPSTGAPTPSTSSDHHHHTGRPEQGATHRPAAPASAPLLQVPHNCTRLVLNTIAGTPARASLPIRNSGEDLLHVSLSFDGVVITNKRSQERLQGRNPLPSEEDRLDGSAEDVEGELPLKDSFGVGPKVYSRGPENPPCLAWRGCAGPRRSLHLHC